ncbi:MAG: Asp-tRNA(Asn)/Glu-tRNA(Gln) amidotransferase subunit GatB [bacterium]|nr:Asp-tRNA(Asn)/Glu-tRNA(Gln) amidotransferase subunit GatB [bacterium]
MRLEPVIGLETHVQLKTKSKLFCRCKNDADDSSPNSVICPVCVGHPGVLPIPNEQAVRWAILLGLALRGTITPHSKFDRKHYFYPDLPKAYQISHSDLPIMQDGHLDLDVPGVKDPVRIRIERLHLEEDAAKNIHGGDGKTYVDYNRGGTPLCEIVTKPDFRTAAEAKAYMQELRLIARTLGVSDGDMEKGHLRCDVNISLREIAEDGKPVSPHLNPKTEIKNVNSFKAVERAIEYEIKRQTRLWEQGQIPQITTTRGWNDAKQVTEDQREKEDSADYRYFPEPDIPPMELADLSDELKNTLPELPRAKRARFIDEYGFKPSDAKQLIEDPALSDFAEQSLSELQAWLQARPDIDPDESEMARNKLTKLVSGWLLSKLTGLLVERKIDIRIMKISPENFAEFITLLADGKLTGQSGLKVLGKMLDDGSDPSHAMDDLGASRVDDADALLTILESIIKANPSEVERFKGGEKKLIQWFIGQIMKETRGNADPAIASRIIHQRLKD